VQEAPAARSNIEAGAAVYRADDVHAWMERLARGGKKLQRPALYGISVERAEIGRLGIRLQRELDTPA